MSWTELITLLLMDAWRTATGRNDPARYDPGPFFDDEEEMDPREREIWAELELEEDDDGVEEEDNPGSDEDGGGEGR